MTSAINSGTAGKVNMSREELRNIRMVEAFNVALAKREQRQLHKSARLSAESSSPVPDCCSEAPCSLGLQAAAEQALHFSSAATLPLHAAVPVAALSSSGVCQHGRVRYRCKDCGGSGICQHGKQRSRCTDCRSGSISEASVAPRPALASSEVRGAFSKIVVAEAPARTS